MMRWLKFSFPPILLFIFALEVILCSRQTSLTSDERVNIFAGYHYVKFNDYRFNREHPPLIKQLGALPLLFLKINCPSPPATWTPDYEPRAGEKFLYVDNDADTIISLARLSVMFIALLLGLFIFIWSYRLNGYYSAIISLSLYILCPNIVGHSSVFTNDVPLAALFFITCYFLYLFFKYHSIKYLTATGVFLGLTLVTKFSSIVLLAVLYLSVAIYSLFIAEGKHLKDPSIKFDIKRAAYVILFIFVVSYKMTFRLFLPAIIVLVLSFVLHRLWRDLGQRAYLGSLVMFFILTIAFLIVVLDYTDYAEWFPFHSATKQYFKGFAWFRGHASEGQESFLFGRYSKTGWWYYFPVAIALKTPLPTLLLWLLGLIALLKRQGRYLAEKTMLMVPLAAYMFVACFVNKTNLGIRLVLPIYPFLFVIAGYATILFKRLMYKRLLRVVVIISLIYVALTAYKVFPDNMAYFNELLGKRIKSYEVLGDSNIEWGQDLKKLKRYIQKNNIKLLRLDIPFVSPDELRYYQIPYELMTEKEKLYPKRGCVYALGVSVLQRNDIEWARNRRPDAEIGRTLKIYYTR
jgi:hypothetical protein